VLSGYSNGTAWCASPENPNTQEYVSEDGFELVNVRLFIPKNNRTDFSIYDQAENLTSRLNELNFFSLETRPDPAVTFITDAINPQRDLIIAFTWVFVTVVCIAQIYVWWKRK
jgi:hypothetical protein